MVHPLFSQRQDQASVEEFLVLREGVPPGLSLSLVEFALGYFFYSSAMHGRGPNNDVFAAFARRSDQILPTGRTAFRKGLGGDAVLLLDVVDFLLISKITDSVNATPHLAELSTILKESRSAYTIGKNSDGRFQLQQRQPDELSQVAAAAISEGGRAGEHLRNAWSKAFATDCDPNSACDEAVKAIEIAAKQTVSSRNTRATLGTMISNMRDAPTKWTTDSASENDVTTMISMMEMIWKGHYRHGDESQPIEVSPEGAQMVVQQASLLVHWFQSGRIRLQ